MTELDPSLAPGCYGSALIHRPETPECRTCAFKASCGPLAAISLANLRAKYGVSVAPPKPKVEKPQVTAGAETGLPAKVQQMIERIERAGISVTDKLARGENPFTAKPAFLRVACHLFLRLPNGISREQLTEAFMVKMNWTKGTAQPHAAIATQMLVAMGALEHANGLYRLRRAA